MNSSVPIADNSFIQHVFNNLHASTVGLYVLLAITLPLFYTFAITSLNEGKPTKDGEPPVPPYWLPFVGNGISMLFGQEKLLRHLRKQNGPGLPYTLYIFGQKIYCITDPASIQTMWRKSKTLAFGPLQNHTITEFFGGNQSCIDALAVGVPGCGVPDDGTKLAVMKHVGDLFHRDLTPGPGLDSLTSKLIEELNIEMENTIPVGDWIKVDLFDWVKKLMFPSSGRALYGYKLRMTDQFIKDFYAFDSKIPELMKMYPDFMIPGARAARSRVLKEFWRWRNEVKDLRYEIPDDVLWDENFGTRIIKERVKLAERGLEPDDELAHGTFHLSLFWGLEANAIPAASWMLGFTLMTPGLASRLRTEIETCKLPSTPSRKLPTFNIERLTKLPLLNSVYQESLRLGVSSLSPRFVIEDTEVDGFMYKKGNMIQGLANLVQLDEVYFGPNPTEFNPDRFMPLPGESETAAAKRNRELLSKVKPFGGGASYCPGRHFAGQEILALVAVALCAFEWDVGNAKMPLPDEHYFGAGGLPPLNDITLKLRRKK